MGKWPQRYGGEWATSRPGRFDLGEIAPDTDWIGDWVCAMMKRNLAAARNRTPGRPARSFTDSLYLVQYENKYKSGCRGCFTCPCIRKSGHVFEISVV